MRRMGNLNQFGALLWKAYCTRKFHYFVSLLSISIPLLLGYAAVMVKEEFSGNRTQSETIFQAKSKDSIIKSAFIEFGSVNILFTPNTSEIFNLMNTVRYNLRDSKIGTFLPMENEEKMEKWFYKQNSTLWDLNYGIVFNSLNNKLLNYSIRNTEFEIWHTYMIFPELQTPGPMEAGNNYLHRGFLSLQIAIDEAFMEMIGFKPIEWTLQEFPYPEYKTVDQYKLLYKEILPSFINYGYLFTIVALIRSVAEEKESGMRIRLKMTGVKSWVTYAVWIVDYGLVALITSAILSCLFTAPWISSTGVIFEKSSFLVIWINIFLFYLLTIFYAIGVANLFTKARYAVFFGTCGTIMSYLLISYINSRKPSSSAIFFISFIPSGFLLWSIDVIIQLEVLGTGATLSSLYTEIESTGKTLPFGYIWTASLIGMAIVFLLILHFDAVLPGSFGTAEPWYWFLPKSDSTICKVCPHKKNSSIFEDRDEIGKTFTENLPENAEEEMVKIEPVMGNPPVGIQICHLTKKYSSVLALHDFSINIYKNQITALLGHNGAGKTTLLSIITGMLSATDGDVYADDTNILHNYENFRRELGYCPQHDLLLPSLTVSEHMIFFGMMKGISKALAAIQCDQILNKCVLTDKKNTRVSALSGGMKRRLCLSISLVNNPKFLILDEPTSGLDPESRRTIWDILLELRRECTVLLSTHFMEEADVLGERIAIMSHGELKCYGTSMFLKKIYGSGYHITVLFSSETPFENLQKIVTIVTTHVPEASIINQSTESISIRFPLNAVEHFPSLFEQLENSNQLGVTGLTVSCTTIDDVFQKVHEEEGVNFQIDEVDMPLTYTRLRGNEDNETLTTIGSLIIAFVEKRCLWIYRNWIITLLYVAIPLFFIITAARRMGDTSNVAEGLPLLLNLKMYGFTEVFMADGVTPYSQPFAYQIKDQDSEIISIKGSETLVNALLDFGRKNEAKYRTSLIVSGDMNESLPNVLYSSIAIHSLPIAVNLLTNSFINRGFNDSLSNQVVTYNYPYTFKSDACSGGVNEMSLVIAYTLMITIVFSSLLSFFIILPHIERKNYFKELQLLGNLQYPVYWLLTFLVDFIVYFLIVLLIIISMLVFDSAGMVRSWPIIGNIFLVFLLYGLSGIWCAYLFSFMFNSYNGATQFFSLFTLALCIAGLVVYSLFMYTGWKYVFFISPLNPLTSASFKILALAKFNLMCEICRGAVIPFICSAAAKKKMLEEYDFSTELIYLGLDWIIYVLIIFLIDSGIVSFVWHLIKSLIIGSIQFPERPNDPDVFQEKAKVQDLMRQGAERPVLIVDGLAKKYSRNVTAVKDVSFAVPQGQCFGLLGTNGAGKSTTFQMLTANILPTCGDSLICGYTLKKNKRKYKSQIGYCPQSGGLLEDLTAKETLRFFARIRGIPTKEIDKLVEKWIRLLGLTEYQNRISSTYSGGNLRKLSTAVALIGNPPVVFLDEPTTGVDPVTRRKIWHVLKMMQDNNQTIVITSHSMDECEALCDRLTIMVRGTMQCIGNIQYLKKAYGKGFTILIKLGPINSDDLKELKEKMQSTFSNNCSLWDEYKGLLHYHLEDTTHSWSSLFKNMAMLKAEFVAIEDYVLTDSSLEQVFLSFASRDDDAVTALTTNNSVNSGNNVMGSNNGLTRSQQ